jgi:hypothetical protein
MGPTRLAQSLFNPHFSIFLFLTRYPAKPEKKRTLPLALLKCAKQPFIAAVIPRIFLIIFRYSQPILIKKSINFVMFPTGAGSNYGYWLVLSAVVIYTGLAVSSNSSLSAELC